MFQDHRRQLKQYVAVQTQTVGTLDAYGKPTWATATQKAARVEPMTKTFDNADGTQAATDWLVVTETEIKLTDRVWLPPDGDSLGSLDATKASLPQRVFKRINVDGTASHWEAHL